MHMRIDAARQYEHALRINLPGGTVWCRQSFSDFCNGAALYTDVSFGTPRGGDDEAVANDEIRWLLPCQAREPGEHGAKRTNSANADVSQVLHRWTPFTCEWRAVSSKANTAGLPADMMRTLRGGVVQFDVIERHRHLCSKPPT